MHYLVLFSRPDAADDLPTGSTTNDHYDELVRELHEHDPDLRMKRLGNGLDVGTDQYALAFVVVIAHDGDVYSLARRLQDAYDFAGAGGHFEIVASLPLDDVTATLAMADRFVEDWRETAAEDTPGTDEAELAAADEVLRVVTAWVADTNPSTN